MADNKEFLVVKRWLDSDDDVMAHIGLVITDAPEHATAQEVMEAIEKIGFELSLLYGNEESVDFYSGYKVIGSEEVVEAKNGWKAQLGEELAEFKEFAKRKDLPYANVSCFSSVKVLTYAELVDILDDEKRFTLRLPLGLHTDLTKAAKGTSLNKFCVQALAKAVGYKLSA